MAGIPTIHRRMPKLVKIVITKFTPQQLWSGKRKKQLIEKIIKFPTADDQGKTHEEIIEIAKKNIGNGKGQ